MAIDTCTSPQALRQRRLRRVHDECVPYKPHTRAALTAMPTPGQGIPAQSGPSARAGIGGYSPYAKWFPHPALAAPIAPVPTIPFDRCACAPVPCTSASILAAEEGAPDESKKRARGLGTPSKAEADLI